MPILPPENNFADLREAAGKILGAPADESIKRLILVVGMLSYRCDLLERQVERLVRADAPDQF
jgi:hypothetical protein